MVERDIGSTFVMSQSQLFKPDRVGNKKKFILLIRINNFIFENNDAISLKVI